MRRPIAFLALAFLALAGRTLAQQADHVVISEFRYWETSGVNEEFVELQNPTDTAVDMSNWRIQYKSSTGTTWQDKQTFPAGTVLQPHRFLLFGGTAVVPAPDFPSAVTLGLGNSGGHVRLVTASLVTVDRVAWLAGDTPEGTGISDAGVRGASHERKAFETSTAASMAPGGTDAGEGNGWDAGNNAADFVAHTAIANSNPQNGDSDPEPDVALTNGSGTAECSLSLVDSPAPVSFSVTVTAEEYELETVELVVPAGWSVGGVNIVGGGFSSASFQLDGDTLRITGAALLGEENGIIELADVQHPTATGLYPFIVRTAVPGGTPLAIEDSPAIQVVGDPIEIAELHVNAADGTPLLLGQVVVVRGVITADTQQGVAVYMQDGSGGIVCYSASFSSAVNIGDDVTVMGTVTQFNGLVELTPADLLTLHGTGVAVEPNVVTVAEVNAQGAAGEPLEGTLIRVNGVSIQGTGTWAGNTNYTFTDATGTGSLRIHPGCGLVGLPIPTGAVDMIGVLGQYDTSSPYHSGYQLLPRLASDQIQLVGPGISGGPWESAHSTSSVSITFTTQNPGSTMAEWSSAVGQDVGQSLDENLVTEHTVLLQGLEAGTPYAVRVGSTNETGTSWSSEFFVSTVSANPGSIEVLFTHDAETEFAIPGNEAEHSLENQIPARLNALIAAAETSIDCAIYSLNIASIATALIEAHDRGVAVRFIYDADHSQPEVNQLVNAGITVIDNSYGQHSSTGIQHNKFMVFDATDENPLNDIVWTGSTNLIDQPSDNGIHAKDNVVLFRDQAVARAYTLEFNEMWGGAGMMPDPAQSLFGEYKTNNTPHYFVVGDTPVELYFSHGDNTSQHLVDALETAEDAVFFCIYTFTRNELGYAMRDAQQRGAAVRGVFDTQGDQFSEWITLQEAGADIHVTDGGGILHHKYMIIDGESPESDPMVVAGSYNWSNSAEDTNNENTFILHSALLANQYLQEFASRYHQAGGTGDFSAVEEPASAPQGLEITGCYPNPFNPSTQVELVLPSPGAVRLQAFDIAGRLVWTRELGEQAAGVLHRTLDFSAQASGMYVLRAEHPAGVATQKLLLVR